MDTLRALIQQGEHQQLDFKFRIDDSKKIARTLCAFANTDGGKLLIGVKDNGKVVGVDPTEELHMIEAAADMYVQPKLAFTYRTWQEEYKLVLEISVESDPTTVYKAITEEGNWKSYVRIQDHTTLANKIILGYWRNRSQQAKMPQKFGEAETQLIRLINDAEGITLSQLYKKSTLKMNQVDHLLISLLCWDLVTFSLHEGQIIFKTKTN